MRNDGYFDYNRMPMHRGVVGTTSQWDAGYIVALIAHIAIVAVFVWAVIMVVKYAVRYLNAKSGMSAESAEEIAKKRFASGDITKAEYEQLKKDLK